MASLRSATSAWIYFSVCSLVIFDTLFDIKWLMIITVGCVISYIILQFKDIPIQQKFAGMALLIIGLLAANESGNLRETLINGVERSPIFLLISPHSPRHFGA